MGGRQRGGRDNREIAGDAFVRYKLVRDYGFRGIGGE